MNIAVSARTLKWLLLGGITLAALTWCAAPLDYLKLQRQCRIDGGLTINRNVSARGVIISERDSGNCELCKSLILNQIVDFAIFNSHGFTSHGHIGEPGLYRMSFECPAWKAYVPKSDECVSVSKLDTPPAEGYALTESSYEKVPPSLSSPKNAYSKIEYVLHDVANGEIIALYRRYSYVLPFSRLLHDPTPEYWCPKEFLSVEDFLRKGLALGTH